MRQSSLKGLLALTFVLVLIPVLFLLSPKSETGKFVQIAEPCCESTGGWKTYESDVFSLKYPPDMTVQNIDDTRVIIRKEDLNAEAFDPIQLEIDIARFSVPADGNGFPNEVTVGRLAPYIPDWTSFFTWSITSEVVNAKELIVRRTEIDGMPAIYFFYSGHQGMDGPTGNQSGLMVKIDDADVLSIEGDYTGSENLSILHTIFSTIQIRKI